jgi:hypothetical protein
MEHRLIVENEMNADVGNQVMLQVGANFSLHRQHDGGWQPIDTAPKDGTIVEIRCTYGVAPWYGLYRWTKQVTMPVYEKHADGGYTSRMQTMDSPGWHKVGDESAGFSEDSSVTWRPYKGAELAYVDPTGGAQNSMAYWRGASAAKAGLPLDAFEADTKHNEKSGWWDSFVNWLTR